MTGLSTKVAALESEIQVLREEFAKLATAAVPRPISTVPLGRYVLVFGINHQMWVAKWFTSRETDVDKYSHWLPMPPDPPSSSGKTSDFGSGVGGSNPSGGTITSRAYRTAEVEKVNRVIQGGLVDTTIIPQNQTSHG